MKDILEKPVWGPVFWKVFHMQAKKGFTERWLDRFDASIICPDCKEHWIALRSRFPRCVFKDDECWGWAMHNFTNTEHANRPFYSYEEFQRHRND